MSCPTGEAWRQKNPEGYQKNSNLDASTSFAIQGKEILRLWKIAYSKSQGGYHSATKCMSRSQI